MKYFNGNFYRLFRKLNIRNLPGAVLSAALMTAETKKINKRRNTHVYSWGSDNYFQTGLGIGKNVTSPNKIQFFDGMDIVDVVSNGQQSVALSDDGKLYSFGRGEDFRLGHGSESNEVMPRLIEKMSSVRVSVVSAGEKHFAAVAENGDLWTWGNGNSGQLGKRKSKLPEKVEKLPPMDSVSCGKLHTVALARDGRVFSCGEGRWAALGHGDRNSREEFTEIENLSKRGEKIVKVAAGEDFSLFLTESGKVFSCGASDFGQTGLGQEERYYLKPKEIAVLSSKNIESFAGKYMHSLAWSKSSPPKIFSWGLNKKGQLGLGDNVTRSAPSEMNEIFDDKWTKVISADTGAGHSAIILQPKKGDRRIFVFGDGRYGQLGRGKVLGSVVGDMAAPVEITQSFKGCKPLKVSLGSEHSLCLCEE